MKQDAFIRQSMMITCVSLLLEIFGQLYISLITSFGYVFYCTQPKYIAVLFCLSWQADNGGLLFGSLFGKNPFAHGISPKKTREGIIGAIILCITSAVVMHYVTK